MVGLDPTRLEAFYFTVQEAAVDALLPQLEGFVLGGRGSWYSLRSWGSISGGRCGGSSKKVRGDDLLLLVVKILRPKLPLCSAPTSVRPHPTKGASAQMVFL